MFIETRDDARGFFLRVWQKMATDTPMEQLEALVAEVIKAHPEYHPALRDPQRALVDDFDAASAAATSNPFLHMGLHIALVEQLQTDRPSGIRTAYQQLHTLIGDPHETEHRMMDYLAEEIRQAGQDGRPPDAEAYLRRLRQLLK
ncbi:MAG: DUF1841 family protein [Gammaproteobacteria bacterium]